MTIFRNEEPCLTRVRLKNFDNGADRLVEVVGTTAEMKSNLL